MIKYFCDSCGKEVPKAKPLGTMEGTFRPSRRFEEQFTIKITTRRGWSEEWKDGVFCPSCLRQIIEEAFLQVPESPQFLETSMTADKTGVHSNETTQTSEGEHGTIPPMWFP